MITHGKIMRASRVCTENSDPAALSFLCLGSGNMRPTLQMYFGDTSGNSTWNVCESYGEMSRGQNPTAGESDIPVGHYILSLFESLIKC